ncbi:MAG: hypothetical protein ACK5RL_13180 [Acidimicrobiales bacterium]
MMVPYDLRHTAITLQSKQGYSDWELADWAGTSERMINETYRHRTDKVVGVRPLAVREPESAKIGARRGSNCPEVSNRLDKSDK